MNDRREIERLIMESDRVAERAERIRSAALAGTILSIPLMVFGFDLEWPPAYQAGGIVAWLAVPLHVYAAFLFRRARRILEGER